MTTTSVALVAMIRSLHERPYFHRFVFGSGEESKIPLPTHITEGLRYYRIFALGGNQYLINARSDYEHDLIRIRNGEATCMNGRMLVLCQHMSQRDVFLVREENGKGWHRIRTVRFGDRIEELQRSEWRPFIPFDVYLPGWFPFRATDIYIRHPGEIVRSASRPRGASGTVWAVDHMKDAPSRDWAEVTVSGQIHLPPSAIELGMGSDARDREFAIRSTPYGWLIEELIAGSITRMKFHHSAMVSTNPASYIHDPIYADPYVAQTSRSISYFRDFVDAKGVMVSRDGRRVTIPEVLRNADTRIIDDVDVMNHTPTDIIGDLAEVVGKDFAGYVMAFYFPHPF